MPLSVSETALHRRRRGRTKPSGISGNGIFMPIFTDFLALRLPLRPTSHSTYGNEMRKGGTEQ